MKTRTLSLILAGLLLLGGCDTRPPPMTEERARSLFTLITGISLTNDSSFVGFINTRNGFNGNGETGVVVRVSERTMQTLTSGAPPLGDKWMKGPVEGVIGRHCAFIYSDSPSYGWAPGEEVQYRGGLPEVIELLSDSGILYCAEARRLSESQVFRWERGTLLVLRPSDSTVWLSVWDW